MYIKIMSTTNTNQATYSASLKAAAKMEMVIKSIAKGSK
jgi:hypothetical protein